MEFGTTASRPVVLLPTVELFSFAGMARAHIVHEGGTIEAAEEERPLLNGIARVQVTVGVTEPAGVSSEFK